MRWSATTASSNDGQPVMVTDPLWNASMVTRGFENDMTSGFALACASCHAGRTRDRSLASTGLWRIPDTMVFRLLYVNGTGAACTPSSMAAPVGALTKSRTPRDDSPPQISTKNELSASSAAPVSPSPMNNSAQSVGGHQGEDAWSAAPPGALDQGTGGATVDPMFSVGRCDACSAASNLCPSPHVPDIPRIVGSIARQCDASQRQYGSFDDTETRRLPEYVCGVVDASRRHDGTRTASVVCRWRVGSRGSAALPVLTSANQALSVPPSSVCTMTPVDLQSILFPGCVGGGPSGGASIGTHRYAIPFLMRLRDVSFTPVDPANDSRTGYSVAFSVRYTDAHDTHERQSYLTRGYHNMLVDAHADAISSAASRTVNHPTSLGVVALVRRQGQGATSVELFRSHGRFTATQYAVALHTVQHRLNAGCWRRVADSHVGLSCRMAADTIRTGDDGDSIMNARGNKPLLNNLQYQSVETAELSTRVFARIGANKLSGGIPVIDAGKVIQIICAPMNAATAPSGGVHPSEVFINAVVEIVYSA